MYRGRVDDRKRQAKERQAKSDAKTPQERLAALDSAGLVATKERAKLADKIEKAAQATKLAREADEAKARKGKKGK